LHAARIAAAYLRKKYKYRGRGLLVLFKRTVSLLSLLPTNGIGIFSAVEEGTE